MYSIINENVWKLHTNFTLNRKQCGNNIFKLRNKIVSEWKYKWSELNFIMFWIIIIRRSHMSLQINLKNA